MGKNKTAIIKGEEEVQILSKPETLQKLVKYETKNREILKKYISDHLQDGTDFGRIHISRNCPDSYSCTYEKNPKHFSKPSLFKAGAEKFCSLMNLKAIYKKDSDTWEMAGSQPGMFCYVCTLTRENGKVAGEGRGACSASEKGGNVNNAIKIAEKRAKVDAILSTGALSDFFTQDIEDMGLGTNSKAALPAQAPAVKTITQAQQLAITELLQEKGKNADALRDWCKRAFNLTDPAKMTMEQASKCLNQLKKLPNYEPEEINPDAFKAKEKDVEVDLDEVEEGMKKEEI